MFDSREFTPLKCQLFSELLVKAASVCFKEKLQGPFKKQLPHPKINSAWKKLQRSYKIWKSAGKSRDSNDQYFLQYKKSRANYQKVRRNQ